MEKSETALKSWLEDKFAPVVLLRATPEVEKIISKNKLTMLEFLTPYEKLSKEVSVRTVKENETYSIKDFKIRFRYLSDLAPSEKSIESMISNAIDGKTMMQNIPNINDKKSALNAPKILKSTPWFEQWRDVQFDQSFRCQPWDCLEHPVAAINFVSSDTEDPVSAFTKLYDPKNLPEVFHKNSMDPEILSYYVLIHDNENTSVDKKKLDSLISKISSTFGVGATRLVYVNSRKKEEPPVKDIWKGTGAECISPQDLIGIASTMEGIIVSGILPQLERKIKAINSSVVIPKKSIKTAFFGLFAKKKSKEGDRYTHDNPEMQMRRMSDLCMMMKDYDSAISTLKLAIPDFRANRDQVHAAACNEAIAWCLLMSQGNKREIDSCFEQAYRTFKPEKINHYALRCCLVEGISYLSRGDFVNAAESYKRAISIEGRPDTIYGMLYEQLALCYLYQTITLHRKFAMNMIFAGSRFMVAQQNVHAFRCYLLAVKTYQDMNWTEVNDHLNESLSRLAASMGDTSNAMQRVHELLKNCKDEPEKQAIFYKDFLEYSSNVQKIIPNLAIPDFSPEIVVYANEYGYSGPVDEIPDESWQVLEETLLKAVGRKNVVMKWEKQIPKFYTVAANEPIYVEVLIKNPLDIDVPIDELKLFFEFNPSTETSDGSNVDISRRSFVLTPKEEKRAKLELIPRVEGQLILKGIDWLVANTIVGKMEFVLKGKRKNESKIDRSGFFYEEDNRNILKIVSGLPRLDVSFDVPLTMVEGEVHHVDVILKNIGSSSLTNVFLKTNHPRNISIAENRENTTKESLLIHSMDSKYLENLSFWKLPLQSPLEPGKSASFPLSIRAAFAGAYDLDFLFYYESVEEIKQMPYRLLRLGKQMRVEKALHLTPFTQVSFKSAAEFTLGVTIKNTKKDAFSISQITSTSPGWAITPFLPLDDCLIGFDESYTHFFKINKIETEPERLIHSSHSFGPGTLIDTTQDLWRDLLYREYLHDSGFSNRAIAELLEKDIEKKRTVPTKGGMKDFSHLSHFPFLESFGLTLQLFWKYAAQSREIQGVSITDVHFQPQRNLKISKHENSQWPSKKNLTSPIRVSLKRVCIIPIQITIENFSADMRVENLSVNFFTSQVKREIQSKGITVLSLPFKWIGVTKMNIQLLKPGESKEYSLQAMLMSKGVYNLNLFKVSFENKTLGTEQKIAFDLSQYLLYCD